LGIPPEECEEQADEKIEVMVPGENVVWIDTLDSTPKRVVATDANRAQTRSREVKEAFQMADNL
jgi:hypothetical protein